MNHRTPTRLAEAKIYTMRQLNQDTGGVLREIAEEGQPAFVTRMGRFVAQISPVPASSFEARSLSLLLEQADAQDQYTGERTADELMSSADLLEYFKTEPRGELVAESEADEQLETPALYSMRQLSHKTAEVIKQINDRDRPALITRRGRIVAILTPLVSARLEEVALAAILETAEAGYMSSDAAAASTASAETADDLGVTWRAR